MSMPCGHIPLVSNCHVCKLALTNYRYAKLWGLSFEAIAIPQASKIPLDLLDQCENLGEITKRCKTCQNGRRDERKCKVFGIVTLNTCETCLQHTERENVGNDLETIS